MNANERTSNGKIGLVPCWNYPRVTNDFCTISTFLRYGVGFAQSESRDYLHICVLHVCPVLLLAYIRVLTSFLRDTAWKFSQV